MPQGEQITIQSDDTARDVNVKGILPLVVTAMRPHQWVKNLFIFAPLLFGMKLTDIAAIGNSLLAFGVFCLMASGLYIVNDVIDADEDRMHPEKRFRPISSGALSVNMALTVSGLLIITSFALAIYVNLNVLMIAALYFVLTLSYCLILKNVFLLDGLTISTGFVLRIVGGALAIGVMPTHWLIVCAFLLALFLAFTKRRQEILVLSEKAGEHRQVLDQYSVPYLDQVNNILIGAAIVCYALYAVAPETVARFKTDALIYGTVFVIYGMLRYLALIRNPSSGENPSKMLLSDWPLLITVASWGIYNAAVIYHLKWIGILLD